MTHTAEDGNLHGATTERSRYIAAFWRQEVFEPDHLPPLLAEQLGIENLYFRNANRHSAPDLYLGHTSDEKRSDKEPHETALATANVGILTAFAGINPEGRIIVAGYDMKNAGELLRLKVSITFPESREIVTAAEEEAVGIFDTLVSMDTSGYSDHTTPIVRGMLAGKDVSGLARLVNLPEGVRIGPQTPFGFSEKSAHDYGVNLGFHAERTDTTVTLSYKDAFRVEIPRFLHR